MENKFKHLNNEPEPEHWCMWNIICKISIEDFEEACLKLPEIFEYYRTLVYNLNATNKDK